MTKKHTKRCSMSLIIRERQTKTTIRCHLTSEWLLSKNLLTRNAGEGVEKRESLCSVNGNVNWYNHYGELYGGSLKTNRTTYCMTQQSHFWAYNWKKTITQKDTCMSVFTATLLTTARTWKKSKCSSTEEWIKKI